MKRTSSSRRRPRRGGTQDERGLFASGGGRSSLTRVGRCIGFGQPLAALGVQPAWSRLITISSSLMVLAGPAVVLFDVVVWYRSFWTLVARVQYTVLAALAIAILPVLRSWNLL